jgi:hypothetical protein
MRWLFATKFRTQSRAGTKERTPPMSIDAVVLLSPAKYGAAMEALLVAITSGADAEGLVLPTLPPATWPALHDGVLKLISGLTGYGYALTSDPDNVFRAEAA